MRVSMVELESTDWSICQCSLAPHGHAEDTPQFHSVERSALSSGCSNSTGWNWQIVIDPSGVDNGFNAGHIHDDLLTTYKDRRHHAGSPFQFNRCSAIGQPEAEGVYRKVTWRLLPFLFVCYVFAYLDRANVGFAHLQFSKDIGLSDAAFGLGVGLFYVGYMLFEVPSNLWLARVGVRKTLLRIMALWGIVSAGTAFVHTPTQFYIARVLLGAAEAGFFPGVILYFTYWFPAARRARVTSIFMTAICVSGIISGPCQGWILNSMSGLFGYKGWQWLFLLEGLPSVVAGVFAYVYLTDRPEQATWLSDDEKALLLSGVEPRRANEGRPRSWFDLGGIEGAEVLFPDLRVFQRTVGEHCRAYLGAKRDPEKRRIKLLAYRASVCDSLCGRRSCDVSARPQLGSYAGAAVALYGERADGRARRRAFACGGESRRRSGGTAVRRDGWLSGHAVAVLDDPTRLPVEHRRSKWHRPH